MALIKCYECGASISDQSVSCPKCGAPNKMRKPDNNTVDSIVDNTHEESGSVKINNQDISPESDESRNKSNKKGIIVLITLIIVAVVSGALFFVTRKPKASDEKIYQEAESLTNTTNMMGVEFKVAAASRSNDTGMPTILYIMNYPGSSTEFAGMSSSERAEFDATIEKLLGTFSKHLSDVLGEQVVLGINVMSSLKTDILMTHQPEIVAEYYDYGDEKKNEEIKKAAADSLETDYEQLKDFAKNKDWKSAISLYKSSRLSESSNGYLDSKKYYFYAQGLSYYDKNLPGEAYGMLEKYCQDILDTKELMKEIENTCFGLDGLYKNDDVSYYMCLSISKGKLSFDSYSDSSSVPSERSYLDTLMIYPSDSNKYADVSYTPGTEPKVNYEITVLSNGKLSVKAPSGNSYTTFNGTYSKVSDTPIKKKS